MLFELFFSHLQHVNFFQAAGLQFRGERIWRAAVDDLKAKGMQNAKQVYIYIYLHFFLLLCSICLYIVLNLLITLQALLSGCSAGGLAVILRCDEFSNLFSTTTKVKCLSDA